MASMTKWRPFTTGILISGVVLIIVALTVSYILNNFHSTTQVRLGSGVFNVRLAMTEHARERGLSGVETLNGDEGLLMVFENEGAWPIWMKDMKVPLDIIWLNSDKKVVYTVANASPSLGTSKTFTPTSPAKYVLEVPAGTVKDAAIKTGSTATFTIEEQQ